MIEDIIKDAVCTMMRHFWEAYKMCTPEYKIVQWETAWEEHLEKWLEQ